jgi:phage terminase large subunit-like protein
VHEHPDNSVIEMLRAGTKGKQDALIFEITNSGFDKKSVCGQEHDYSVKS